ncbi:uncharacterized protein LA080_012471 [Diaporthe eres]|nr:uncharacterized protein LA080_012471 [Diaporthe eres]
MLFDMSNGDTPPWGELNEAQKRSLLTQAASSRAALLNKPLPAAFVATWLFWTSFQPVEWMPKMFPLPPAGNRDFCIAMLKAKVEGLVGSEEGGDDEVLYRLVLQHDDFGLHNIPVDVDEAGELSLTSVYDWGTGCIIPVILTEIEFSIHCTSSLQDMTLGFRALNTYVLVFTANL